MVSKLKKFTIKKGDTDPNVADDEKYHSLMKARAEKV